VRVSPPIDKEEHTTMGDAVIVSTARTPIGKAFD
jgi:hypothetical protein